MVTWSQGAENEQRTEQSKVTIRWIVVTVALAAVTYMRRTGTVDTPWPVIVVLTAVIAALNLGFSAVLRRGAPRWLRYVTTGSDLAMISVLVGYSGGSASPFYYVYFIVLVSNAVRYGSPT
jgi:cell division protein FtsW (lipid II flippase)